MRKIAPMIIACILMLAFCAKTADGPGPMIDFDKDIIPRTVHVGEKFTIDVSESEPGEYPIEFLRIQQKCHSSVTFDNYYENTLVLEMSFGDIGRKVLHVSVIEDLTRGWSSTDTIHMTVIE